MTDASSADQPASVDAPGTADEPASVDAPGTADVPASVAIVGLGLIGGSLAMALRAHVPGIRITGIDSDGEVGTRAVEEGVCNRAGTSASLLPGHDLVALAVPLDALAAWLDACGAKAPDVPVTDCGSTKAWIVERARHLAVGLRFLGGHPMAGGERTGYANADPALFAGCTWVLTPERDEDLDPFSPWVNALRRIGAHVEVTSAAEHDRAAAWVSHLPLALSSALLRTAGSAAEWPLARWLAAGGFRDTSRLAGGDPRLPASISATNGAALGRAIDAMVEQLRALRAVLDEEDRTRLYFEEARDVRAAWLAERAKAGRPVR